MYMNKKNTTAAHMLKLYRENDIDKVLYNSADVILNALMGYLKASYLTMTEEEVFALQRAIACYAIDNWDDPFEAIMDQPNYNKRLNG